MGRFGSCRPRHVFGSARVCGIRRMLQEKAMLGGGMYSDSNYMSTCTLHSTVISHSYSHEPT